jgi:hypothetical protein
VGSICLAIKHRRIIARLQRLTVTDLTELIRHMLVGGRSSVPSVTMRMPHSGHRFSRLDPSCSLANVKVADEVPANLRDT